MTTPNRPFRKVRSLFAIVLIAATLEACTSGSGGATTSSTAVSAAPSAVGPSAGEAAPSGGPDGDAGPGEPMDLVVPKPGQLDVHPISADSFAARVDGRHVVLTITYTSGVEPCSILDTIIVARGEGTFAITLREGHGPGDQICIMIAKVMKTQVDLGELDPGTYTISDTTQGADSIKVVVS
jgi:hypothetical protein